MDRGQEGKREQERLQRAETFRSVGAAQYCAFRLENSQDRATHLAYRQKYLEAMSYAYHLQKESGVHAQDYVYPWDDPAKTERIAQKFDRLTGGDEATIEEEKGGILGAVLEHEFKIGCPDIASWVNDHAKALEKDEAKLFGLDGVESKDDILEHFDGLLEAACGDKDFQTLLEVTHQVGKLEPEIAKQLKAKLDQRVERLLEKPER